MDTKMAISQFLTLQSKNMEELQALCKRMNIAIEGSEPDLIDRLMNHQEEVKQPVLLPQAIPLRTVDSNGRQMHDVVETIKRWRRLIYETQGNQRNFELVNSKGEQYKARLKYLRCSLETLKGILEQKWYFAHASQQPIIDALIKRPWNFEVHIVQKPSSRGNSWVMIHVKLKAA